jgi:hypothetical protein
MTTNQQRAADQELRERLKADGRLWKLAYDEGEGRGRAERDKVWRAAIEALIAEWDSPEVLGGREIAADMNALVAEVTK